MSVEHPYNTCRGDTVKTRQNAGKSDNPARVPGRQIGNLARSARDSPATQSLTALQRMADQSAVVQNTQNTVALQRTEEEELQGEFIQRVEEDDLQMKPIQPAEARKANSTGMPDNLKSGIENLSGMSMDHVKVNYNSDKPATVQAHAYAQGSQIHLAPGQERHLPHEAWHVVQQAQGRVKPTTQLKGIGVNDDPVLEQEADVMGAQALQAVPSVNMPSVKPTPTRRSAALAATSPLPKGLGTENDVAQLALATVNPQNGPVNLTQIGGGVGGGFIVMQNAGQPAGNAVSNAVGFTGVLDADAWQGLAKSPRSYWRAHGYAMSFGGAGDETNVGWWTETAESEWTTHEQYVRGAGLDQIADWTPGVGETGTYRVNREMHPTVDLSSKYVGGIEDAMNWALDSSRPAWQRALATCRDIHPAKEKEKRLALLENARQAQIAAVAARALTWITTLFGTAPVNSNLIKKMTMTYTITNAGAGPGASRAKHEFSKTSGLPNKAQFGLKTGKQSEIWSELFNHNNGIFASGTSPATLMTGRVGYDDTRKPAQVLTAQADGWGVP